VRLGDALLGVGGKGKSTAGEAGEVPVGACLAEVQSLPTRQFPFFAPEKAGEQPWSPLGTWGAWGSECVFCVTFSPVKSSALLMECRVPVHFSGSLWCSAINGRTWERLSTRFVYVLLTYQQSTCICD